MSSVYNSESVKSTPGVILHFLAFVRTDIREGVEPRRKSSETTLRSLVIISWLFQGIRGVNCVINTTDDYRQKLMSSNLQSWSFHVIIRLLCVNRTETSSEGGACSKNSPQFNKLMSFFCLPDLSLKIKFRDPSSKKSEWIHEKLTLILFKMAIYRQ